MHLTPETLWKCSSRNLCSICCLLLSLIFPSMVCAEEDEEEGTTPHLEHQGMDTGDLNTTLVLTTFHHEKHAPRTLSLDTEGRVKLFAEITRESVMEFLHVHKFCHVTTANVPLFISSEPLMVSGQYISYNLVPRKSSHDLVFGPYIHDWKSVREQYKGHYGLRLMMPW